MFILLSYLFDQKFTSKTVSAGCYLKLRLLMFFTCLLIFAEFHIHVSHRETSH